MPNTWQPYGFADEYSPSQQPGVMYRDDELAPKYGAPKPLASYTPLQPSGAQVPVNHSGGFVRPDGTIYNPPPPPPPPPKPGYETGHTAAIGTPIPGSETGLGAINNDAKAAPETTTAGMQNLIRDQILNMLSQPAPTATDPHIQAQTSAYNAAQNRATARQVNQNAEAFGAAGLESSGARLAADRGAIQEQGLNEGTFVANAVQQELESRRAQIERGLALAASVNDQDLARRLQQELANLTAQIQRESLKQSGELGQSDIDLRKLLGIGSLNVSLLDLAQRGLFHNDNVGLNLAGLESSLNQNALVKLLGGV
jgi:hypothetical protein